MIENDNSGENTENAPGNADPEYLQSFSLALSGFLKRYDVYILSGLLLTILLILFGSYIFFDRLLLFKDIGSDIVNFTWPSYYHYSQYIRQEGIPRWSFTQGLGQNVFPAFLGDVPGWLVFLVKPANIPYILIYPIMIKIFLSGIFFYLFLKKIQFSEYISVIGAALFAFSGFMIIGGSWYIFATEGCYLSLILLGLELLRKDNNLLVFPAAVALAAANNPVIFYLHGLLIAFYLLFYFLARGFSKASFYFIVKLILLGILGLGISAFFLFGNISQILQSPRGGGNVSYYHILSSKPPYFIESSLYYITFLLRAFGNDMAGYAKWGDAPFQGWYNYLEAPMQYTGLLSLLLIPQLFALADRKLRILAGIALSAAIFPVLFPYFRYAFWLFSGDYFRTYSLFFGVLQILLALKALDLILEQRKINLSVLAGTLGVMLLILFTFSIANEKLKIPVFLFLIVEASLLWLLTAPRFFQIALWSLPLVIFAELTFLSWGTFNERDTFVKGEPDRKAGYNDFSVDAMNMIHANDKGFFRIHKNYSSGLGANPSLNDAHFQNFYSSRSYHTFNQKYYVHFLQKMHMISDSSEAETRWINGMDQHLPLLQIVSGKYLLLSGTTGPMSQIGYDEVGSVGNIKIFRYRYFIPLGFTYDACIPESEMEKVSLHKDAMLLKGVVVDSGLLSNRLGGMKLLSAADTAGTDDLGIYEEFLAKHGKDTLQITSFLQNRIEGKITASEKKVLFLSIPFDPGWKAEIDGKEAESLCVNYGFLGYLLDKGAHRIILKFDPPYYSIGMKISGVSLLFFVLLASFSLFRARKKDEHVTSDYLI